MCKKKIISWLLILLFSTISFGQISSYKNKVLQIGDEKVIRFNNISGPNTATIIKNNPPTSWEKYSSGTSSRLGIFLTDTESSWLGIVHACKSFGIPFTLTTNINEAINHDVLMVYPTITNRNISYEEFVALSNYPKNGGTLIAFNVLCTSLFPTFGFSEIDEAYDRFKIHFNRNQSSLMDDFTNPKETDISFAGDYPLMKDPDLQNFGTFGYLNPEYQPLATFEDGSPAIIQNVYPNGITYAIGFDFGFFNIKAHQNFDQEAQRSYVNGFEPTADLIPRIIKKIYQKHNKRPVTIGMVPFNKLVTILLTHDIDYMESLPNALKFAMIARNNGVPSTYFVQTKYIHDGADSAFFTNETLKYVKALKNMGMEIGSHTVSHSMKLDSVNLGTGKEKYPSYRPFVFSSNSSANISLLGELRVSKFLLDRLIPNQTTISYRSGYLHYPPKLPESLDETNYLFNSSHTANDVLTHVPFRGMENRSFNTESEIFDFCVTIDDEYGLTVMTDSGRFVGDETPLINRLPQARALTYEIGKYGGVVNVLIHPNVTGSKLQFMDEYIRHFKDIAWFGTVGDFGQWWAARDKVSIDVTTDSNFINILMEVPEEINGLNLDIPPGYQVVGVTPGRIDARISGNNLLFDKVQGNVTIILSR